MMKIAIIGGYPLKCRIRGGVQTYILNLTKKLAKIEDIELHIITTGNDNGVMITNENITIHIIKRLQLPFADSFFHIFPIIKKIKEIDPDIVHCQSVFSPYSLATIIVKYKYKVILTVLGIIEQEKHFLWQSKNQTFHRILFSRLEKFIYRHIPNLITPTPYVSGVVQRLTYPINPKIYLIPIGVDEVYFDIENNEKDGRLLFVGVLEPRKGVLDLIKAIEKIKRPTVELHIVGKIKSQRYFREISNYIQKKDLSGNIFIKGMIDEEALKREYGKCSIFILPSYEESFGIVLLEAMAAGKPVIATRVGGIPYVVDHGKTGYLVEKGDIKELMNRIVDLLQNNDERRKMGKEGRERAKNFSWNAIAKKTYECYLEVINRPEEA